MHSSFSLSVFHLPPSARRSEREGETNRGHRGTFQISSHISSSPTPFPLPFLQARNKGGWSVGGAPSSLLAPSRTQLLFLPCRRCGSAFHANLAKGDENLAFVIVVVVAANAARFIRRSSSLFIWEEQGHCILPQLRLRKRESRRWR